MCGTFARIGAARADARLGRLGSPAHTRAVIDIAFSTYGLYRTLWLVRHGIPVRYGHEKAIHCPVQPNGEVLKVAQKVHVVLTDDIDGSEADETVQFALDGVSYEIDLSASNSEALREALAAYVDAARRVGGRSARRQPSANAKSRPAAQRTDLSALRAWARENGYEVSDRGRVSDELKAAYEAAQ